jgi:hypothetical protein
MEWKHHGLVILGFVAVLFVATKSGSFADEVGFELLLLHHGQEIHKAVGIHSAWWDVGVELLPSIRNPWISDMLVFSQLILGIYCIFAGSVFRRNNVEIIVRRLSAFFKIYGMVLFLRTITVYSTVHSVSPVVAERMRAGESLEAIRGSIGYIANTNCFDMMFSGHACSEVVMGLFALKSEAPLIIRAMTIMIALCGPVLLIMVGDHYTSDVLVAVYTTIFVFLTMKSFYTSTFDDHDSDIKHKRQTVNKHK